MDSKVILLDSEQAGHDNYNCSAKVHGLKKKISLSNHQYSFSGVIRSDFIKYLHMNENAKFCSLEL